MSHKDVQDKYQESFQFLQARKTRQVSQLVLLNNLQRGDQNIASTLLLSLFNRILSNLYDNKLQIKFLPSQGITQEQLDSYNILAQSDYIEMNKAKIDYDVMWDTLFFGRGYIETLRFNKQKKIMEPHVINPLVFGYDPYFENPQDWRYYWKWITKSKQEIIRLIKAGAITGITKPEEIASGVDEYLWDYKIRRDQAKKAIAQSADSMGGDIYQILEYYGYDKDGNKCVYWYDRDIDKELMCEKLDLDDGDEMTMPNGAIVTMGSKWPIVVKEAFREPHSTVNFSVADLLEDKHRAKSVLLNLAFVAAKDKANPIYGYNPDKIKDISQFFQRQISQHIPMESEDAAWILNREDPMSQGLLQFISMLTQEANEPVGTGMSMQPMKKGKQTATDSAIQQQLNDLAQSLQSKILQFGEQEFWSHWFQRYRKHGPELKNKMANIVGVKSISSEKIDLADFKTDYPPGVMVFSAKEAEYKELVLRRDLMQLYPQLQETLDPDGMRNFQKHVFFPKFLNDPSLIDVMLPKTLDEMKADDENETLAKDTLAQVAETDNHTTHIYTHMQVTPKTNAVWTHIAWHEELLAKQKMEEKQQEQSSPQGGQNDALAPKQGGSTMDAKKPKVGKDQSNPLKAAVPLATEAKPKVAAK